MNAVRARWDVLASAYMDDVVILAEDPDRLRQAVLEIVAFCEELGWTINKKKSVLEPSMRFVYLGLEWDTLAMTVRMTTKKNTALKKTVKHWIQLTRGGAEVRIRDIAKLIGQLSATRPQHEEASLYLAKLNRLKCTIVRSGGWEAHAILTRALLPELFWWLHELRANRPSNIRAFEPAVTLFTDASETGWGATLKRRTARARWMYGWWNQDEAEVNCLRELAAVVKAMKTAVKKRQVFEQEDVLIRSDNTNVVYNLNRKRSGWRMRAAVKEFMKWLKQKQIRVRCVHVKGELNTTADSLSRLSKSGDYSLRENILAHIEDSLDIHAEVDLFATKKNRQCVRYATVEETGPDDTDVLARNAMLIPWTGWTALVHPPIPMLAQCLAKIRRNGTTAILIAPRWRGAPWMHALRPMLVTKPIVLGEAKDVLIAGPAMKAQNAALPPGLIMACLLDGSRRRRTESD
jgi:ribonuclease HI